MKTLLRSLVLALGCAGSAQAEDTPLTLAVPQVLETPGFMQYLLPRFSLKTSIRITRVPETDAATMAFGETGTPVFSSADRTWHLSHDGDARAQRFLDWLVSDVGVRTIESFAAEDGTRFTAPQVQEVAAAATVFDGDAALGQTVSLEKCGRCHVVNDSNRMKGTGATPSFALMRTFADWEARFATFHILKPHASFTQIEGVTEPFDPASPPPMVPVTMTLDDLDAILAYVAGISPADLGAPLQFQ